jgi:hypothetical protein
MTQDLERRDEQALRAISVPPPLAQIGVGVVEQDGYRMVLIPPTVKDRFNVVSPVQHFAQADPNFTPSVRLIELDVGTLISDPRGGKSPHFYKITKDSFDLSKQGLEALGQAAGVIRTKTRMIPKGELRPGVAYGYRATAWIRRSDGTIESVTRDRDWHEAAERAEIEEEVRRLAARYPDDWTDERVRAETEKRWIAELRFGAAKIESKALNRAVRAALSLPKLTAAQIQKPFLVIGYQLTPNWADPEVQRIMLSAGLGAAGELYPGRADVERPADVFEHFEGPQDGEPQDDTPVPEAPSEPENSAGGQKEAADQDEAGPRAAAPPSASGPAAPQQPEPELNEPPLEPEPEPEPPADVKTRARAVVVPFGRHRGKTLGQVEQDERKYLDWLASDNFNPGTDDEDRARCKAAAKALLG